MSTSRRLAKNFLSLSAAEVLSRLLSALLGFYIARELPGHVFGQFSFAIAFTSFFNIFADLGLSQLAVRDIAQAKGKTSRYGTNILAIQLIMSGILTLLLVSILTVVPLSFTTKLITFLFGVGMIPQALNMGYILQAHERMEFLAVGRVLAQGVYALLGFGLIYATRDVVWLPLALLISGVAGAVTAYYFVRKYTDFHWTSIDVDEMRHLARASLPFLISALAIQVYYNSDSIILQLMKGEVQVGIYNTGYKIVLLILMFGGFIVGAFFPYLSAMWRENEEKFAKTIHYMARVMGLIAIPLTVGGIMVAEKLIMFIYKQEIYREATLSFQILLLLPTVIFVSTILGNTLIAAGEQKRVTIAVVTGAAVNIIINILLIPHFGITGAAAATVAAEIVVILGVIGYYRRIIGVPLWASYLSKPLAAAMLMAVGLYLVRDYLPVILTVALGAIIYMVAIVVLKGVTLEDYRALRHQPIQ
jgi:O-antigen/teichoic acid export membrane protein